MTAPVQMADASNPAGVLPGQAFAFYIGGNTPHVWTAAQVRRQGARPALPIWVHGLGQRANDEAAVAVMMLHRLGVAAGSPVAIDMETSVDPDYVDIFTEYVNLYNYWCVVYGSTSTLFANPRRGGYWAATLNGREEMLPGADIVATQWKDFGAYDMSLITPGFHARLSVARPA